MPPAPHIKLLAAIIAEPSVDQTHTTNLLAEVFGSVDYVGAIRDFESALNEQQPQGIPLVRWIISFTGPHYADILPAAKRACMELERGCSLESPGEQATLSHIGPGYGYTQAITIDVGYLDLHKIVLARTEVGGVSGGQCIYLDDGIYGDIAACRLNSAWQLPPWGSQSILKDRHTEDLSAIYSLFERTNNG